MNFFEKKLAKQFADHLVQKFANGETVKIPEVGDAIYDHEARIIRVDVTNSSHRKSKGKSNGSFETFLDVQRISRSD